MKKKILALAHLIGFMMAAIATLNFVTERTVITVLIFWLAYVLYCNGLVTAKELREFKKEKV